MAELRKRFGTTLGRWDEYDYPSLKWSKLQQARHAIVLALVNRVLTYDWHGDVTDVVTKDHPRIESARSPVTVPDDATSDIPGDDIDDVAGDEGTMTARALTYQELGELLNIETASAKRLAIRKKWLKHLGNDGRARVTVPLDELPERATNDGAGDRTGDDTAQRKPRTGDNGGDNSGDGTDVVASVVTVLANQISRLERDLETLKQEREAERDRLEGRAGALEEKVTTLEQDLTAERLRTAQLEALNAVIEAERRRGDEQQQRAEEWKAERDKATALAEASQRQITEMIEKRRSWWPFRRVG